jgi:acyl-CoA dehydrogenase
MIGGSSDGSMGGRGIGEIAITALGADENGELVDTALRSKIATAELDGWAFLLTMERSKDEAKAGHGIGARSSMLKYYGTELNKRRFELLMASKGLSALEWEGEASNDGQLPRQWLRTKGNSIEGGTSEVQLNIISKRILGLPDPKVN